jgi:iron complex outermembrane recepter protein
MRIAGVLALVLAGVSAGAPCALSAQGTPVTDSAVAKLLGVSVTASRAVGTVGGASAVVVKVGELRSSPAPLLEQALRESPFVHVRQNSRGEMELSVRGSDSRQAAVLLDGVPITLGWDHRTDPSLIPLTGAENIVIVRGLGSLLGGPNTLGGTIEVSHDASAMAERSALQAGAGIDDNSAYVMSFGSAIRMPALAGDFTLQAGAAWRGRDGFALPEDATDPTAADGLRTNSDMKHTDGYASLRWRNDAGRGIGLTVSAFDAERGVPPEEHIASPRLWRYPNHSRTIAGLSAKSGAFATPLGTASLDVGVGYNAGDLRIDTYSNRTYSTITTSEFGDEETLTGRALLTHTLGSTTLRAAFTGADIRYDETLGTDPTSSYQQKMWSAGAELDVPLGARTTLAGGLVFDHTSTPETGGRTPGQEPFDDMGWRAGVQHELNDSWKLHASASQRSRFPALRELYSGALNRFMPNPDLEPETLLGFEGGITMSRKLGSSNATAQATGFRHNLDDAVVRITLPAPDRRFRRINRDRIESTGLELLAGLSFGDNPDRAVSITGDALIQSIDIFDTTVDGEPVRHAENNPERRGTLELGLPLPLEARLFANARYTGTQYCLNADSGAEDTLDSQTESDIGIERSFNMGGRLWRRLRALVAVDNITDSTVYDSCGLPQPGRTLRVMFSVR